MLYTEKKSQTSLNSEYQIQIEVSFIDININITLVADSLSISRRCKINCVVDPFTISVRNTIPPVKKTNCDGGE